MCLHIQQNLKFSLSKDYSQYYDPSTYWQGYSNAWQGYYDQSQTDTTSSYYQQNSTQAVTHAAEAWAAAAQQGYENAQDDDEFKLVGKLSSISLANQNHN